MSILFVAELCGCSDRLWSEFFTNMVRSESSTVYRETCSRVIFIKGWLAEVLMASKNFQHHQSSLKKVILAVWHGFVWHDFFWLSIPSVMSYSYFPWMRYLSFSSLCWFSNFFVVVLNFYHSSAGHSWSATVLVIDNIFRE